MYLHAMYETNFCRQILLYPRTFNADFSFV